MQIAKKVVDGNTLTFVWADETTTKVDLSELPQNIIDRAVIHGLSQKLGDSYSGASGDVRQAQMMFIDTLNALQEGDWNRKGGGAASGGIWVEALAQAAGEEIETALAKWNDMDEETRKSIRKHPQVKLAKAEIEMERAKAKAADAAPISL